MNWAYSEKSGSMHSTLIKKLNIIHCKYILLYAYIFFYLGFTSYKYQYVVNLLQHFESGERSLPGSLFDYALQEDQTCFQTALDLLEEVEDFLIACVKDRRGGRKIWCMCHEQCQKIIVKPQEQIHFPRPVILYNVQKKITKWNPAVTIFSHLAKDANMSSWFHKTKRSPLLRLLDVIQERASREEMMSSA